MKKAKIIALAIIALATIIVVLQNTEAVETKLLFATVTLPRAVLLLVTMLVGVVIGLAGATALLRKKSEPPEKK